MAININDLNGNLQPIGASLLSGNESIMGNLRDLSAEEQKVSGGGSKGGPTIVTGGFGGTPTIVTGGGKKGGSTVVTGGGFGGGFPVGVPVQGVPVQGVPVQGVPVQGVPVQGFGGGGFGGGDTNFTFNVSSNSRSNAG